MERMFSSDSKPVVYLSKFVDMIVLNVIFLVCCIPVFTAGAACTAMYYTCVKVIRKDEGTVFREYFHSFRENFVAATGIWMVILAIQSLMAANILAAFVYAKGTYGAIIAGFSISASLIILAIGVYVFPVLSRFMVKGRDLLRMALVMAVANGKSTVLLVLLVFLFVVLLVLGWPFWPLILLLAPGIAALLSAKVLEPVLALYITEQKADRHGDNIEGGGEDE